MASKEIKKNRGIVKTKLTMTLKRVKAELDEEEKDYQVITDLMQKAKLTTDDLEQLNQKIMFVTEGEEYDEAERYIEECFNEYFNVKKLVNKITKSAATTMVDKTPENEPIQQSLNLKLSNLSMLAATNAIKFNGDPLYYHAFISGYNSAVEGVMDDGVKLKALLAQCEGEAFEAVQFALLRAPNEGLRVALKTLEERYGNAPLIAQSWINKITSTGKIDNSNIRKFSDNLENCFAALSSLNSLGELDNQASIRLIVEKLPRYVQNRWISESARIKRETAAYANLQKLIEFVKRVAEEMTDPILSAGAKPLKPEGTWKKDKEFKTVGKTYHSGKSQFNHCDGCYGSDHRIWECGVFKALDVEGRWDLASKKKLCFKCLGQHMSKNCKRDMVCGIDGCRGDHNRLLHRIRKAQRNPREVENDTVNARQYSPREGEGPKMQSQPSVSRNFLSRSQGTALRIIPVYVRSRDKQLKVNALLDDGSEQTYISSGLAAELGEEGKQGEVCVGLLNGLEHRFSSQEIEVEISSIDAPRENYKLKGLTVDNVCGDLTPIDWPRVSKDWEHLKNIEFPKPIKGGVDMLIGVDHVYLHSALEERHGKRGEPIARKTPLGWTSVGPTARSGRFLAYHLKQVKTFRCGNVEFEVDNIIKKFWETESVGAIKSMHFQTEEETRAYKTVKESMKHDGERYEVKIPWKEEKQIIGNSKVVAEHRFFSLEKKLNKDKALGKAYSDVIKKYEEKGYISKVNDGSHEPVNGVWYLPHFPVVKPNRETTKVRLVYDAAAKYDGTSLNDMIYNGPKLQNDLFDVLLKFRKWKIGLICDISEMYLQIGLAKEDRSMFRFLWKDLDFPSEPDVYEFNRLVFGVNAAPFISQVVSQENAKMFKEEYPLAAEAILESTYMDDTMTCVDEVETCVKLYHELNELWAKAGMKATKWLSNSKEVLSVIPQEHRVKEIKLTENELPSVKTLGVTWLAEQDEFSFRGAVSSGANDKMTKRTVLSKIASVFDPLGLVAPVVVRGKMLMQDIWESGADWDEPLPDRIRDKIIKWCGDLGNLGQIKVSRCLCPIGDQDVELHTFVDASSEAYAAVVYLKSKQGENVRVRLVAAKTKVAPLQSTSIPRLELMAAMLGLKLTESITNVMSLNLHNVVFWSDSTNTLWWIRGRSRAFKPFVANRVGEIQTKTNPSQWRYVPTKVNPADVASRGTDVVTLSADKLWWEGPKFLQQSHENWPQNKVRELKNDHERRRAVNCTFLTMTVSEVDRDGRLDPKRFSNWRKLVCVLAYVSRFITNCRGARRDRVIGVLTVEEIRDAEVALVQQAQQDVFREEIVTLKKKNGVVRSNNILSTMFPKLEGGLLRMDGRLSLIETLPYDTRYPIILPRKHPVTRLIVKEYHDMGNHSLGTNHILALISEKYWIIHGREEIRDCERDCVVCKRRTAKAASQIMAPLPAFRASVSLRAFCKVAVDYAGPFLTKQGRGKVRTKRYLCLFTCLATRAVHLEICYGLETDTFLNAFFRFVSRRGKPEFIMSDNGTNFIGADNELKRLLKLINRSEIKEATAYKGITWSFIPPVTPHFGGVHESLIKSAKRAIYAILKSADITDEELHSAFVGAEGILNSRPLTYQSASRKDATPLTPNHFLHGSVGGNIASEEVLDTVGFNPRKRWRRVQELMKHFWGRWVKEWLPELNKRKKWKELRKDLAVGDLVLTIEKDTQRRKWPLGRVLEIYPGPDGHVRVVKIRSAKGDLIRGITKVCPLEVMEG